MDIKDVLVNGEATPDELLAQFKAQLETAQKAADEEIRARREAEAKAAALKARNEAEADADDLDEARESMILSVLDYMVALGVLEEDEVDAEDIPKLCDLLKGIEGQMKARYELMKLLKSLETPHSPAKQEGKSSPSVRKGTKDMNEDQKLAEFLAQIGAL